ncbi:MAG: hypothetical protein Q9195_004320 [Heterodermia aff. obscurata]
MQLCFACIFSTLTIHCLASPTVKERQQSVCAYPDAPLISSCWDVLDIPDYLVNWSKNVPIATGFQYSDDSCFAGEGWSSCFIRLGWEQVVGIVDCSVINQTDCKFPNGSLREEIAPGTAQQVKYVTSSVVNVHRLFQSLYQVVAANLDSISSLRTSIEATLMVGEKSQSVSLDASNYNIASTAGPAVLVNLTSPMNETGSQTYLASKVFLQSLQRATSVRDLIWPLEYDQSDPLFPNGPPGVGALFTQGLSLMMANSTTIFSDFAAHAAPGRLVSNFQTFQIDCDDDSVDDVGFCTKNGQTVYWSFITGRTFALKNKKQSEHRKHISHPVTPSALLKQTAADGWASIPWMFDGSYNCTAAGRAGGSVLHIEDDGSIDLSCLISGG